jgi:hypothetical protein
MGYFFETLHSTKIIQYFLLQKITDIKKTHYT